MKKYLKAFGKAITMYTIIPGKFHEWNDEDRPLMITTLPFVGVIIGIIWSAVFLCLQVLVTGGFFPKPLAAAIFALFPFVITGGIHMDGMMDTTDALKSMRELPERRRIQKDSTVGAFAVISAIMVFIIWFAAGMSLDYENEKFHTFLFIPIISRCCSALAVSLLPTMNTSEYSGKFKNGMGKKQIIFIVIIGIIASYAGALLCGLYGLSIVALLLGYAYSLYKGYMGMEGMNGDVAGYALVHAETFAVAMFTLAQPLYHTLVAIGFLK